METFSIKDLNFSYPKSDYKVLNEINLDIHQGDFIVLAGESGSGKTTLLKHLKPILTSYGHTTGRIYFKGKDIKTLSQKDEASLIGFVQQNPDNQIVTDKVWHEISFGLESLGQDNQTIRLRVAEVATFFGIEDWFYQDINTLSGGQKQKLNLASIMTLQPEVLILDEPTSQLDPIAASEFLDLLVKINRDLGTTIIMVEHRLNEVLPMCNHLVILDKGQILTQGTAQFVAKTLYSINHPFFQSMPITLKAALNISKDKTPLTIKEGRDWLNETLKDKSFKLNKRSEGSSLNQKLIEVKDVYFKYEEEYVLKDVNFDVYQGEILTLLGGNGVGKSTMLSLLSNINAQNRGKILINDVHLNKIPSKNKYGKLIGLMPQNPETLFVKNTLRKDLEDVLKEDDDKLIEVAKLCQIEHLLDSHPFDLSGGEKQKAALAKLLLISPDILILDEPTKGMDTSFKEVFARILKDYTKQNKTVIIATHDIEFSVNHGDYCMLFFDGTIITHGKPETFFLNNTFYTSQTNRLTRNILDDVVRYDDLLEGFGVKETKTNFKEINLPKDESSLNKFDSSITQRKKEKISLRTKVASLLILLFIPLTIYFGTIYLNDRKYLFISLLILLQTFIPFVMIYESRKPQARELVLIAIMSSLGVASRTVFYMLPQFKPVGAIVIISGIAFGAESGFLVGAMTMLLSNILIGQGPWTPWQMFAMGIIGFLAGILFNRNLLRQNKYTMAIFGGLSVFLIYGGIMNPASVIMFQPSINKSMILSSYITGFPFDLIHASATSIFLFLIGELMLEKLDRIKVKYGLME